MEVAPRARRPKASPAGGRDCGHFGGRALADCAIDHSAHRATRARRAQRKSCAGARSRLVAGAACVHVTRAQAAPSSFPLRPIVAGALVAPNRGAQSRRPIANQRRRLRVKVFAPVARLAGADRLRAGWATPRAAEGRKNRLNWRAGGRAGKRYDQRAAAAGGINGRRECSARVSLVEKIGSHKRARSRPRGAAGAGGRRVDIVQYVARGMRARSGARVGCVGASVGRARLLVEFG